MHRCKSILPFLGIVSGAGLVILALGADLMGFGDAGGIGPKQIMLACTGLAVLATGFARKAQVSRRRWAEWGSFVRWWAILNEMNGSS